MSSGQESRRGQFPLLKIPLTEMYLKATLRGTQSSPEGLTVDEHLDRLLLLPGPAGGRAQVGVLVPEAHGVHGQHGRVPLSPHPRVQWAVYLGPPGERGVRTALRPAGQRGGAVDVRHDLGFGDDLDGERPSCGGRKRQANSHRAMQCSPLPSSAPGSRPRYRPARLFPTPLPAHCKAARRPWRPSKEGAEIIFT